MTKGIMIAAPSSGAGKTTLTLGLLRALNSKGHRFCSAKVGPDYIDPKFHEAASGHPCINLDPFAMNADRLKSLANGPDYLLVEAAMGLFDGAGIEGKGSASHLAETLNLPVILCVDAAKQAHSIAALVKGFVDHSKKATICGVILNRVGSAKHEAMLRNALEPLGIQILGAIPRSQDLTLPSRHLGLVQAEEHPDLSAFIEKAASIIGSHVDLDAVVNLTTTLPTTQNHHPIAPFAQRIAVAQDAAFSFIYPHLIRDWSDMGAEISTFSPLADQAPEDCDFVYLPGGYPELYAGKMAANKNFLDGLRKAPCVYGECGGYMTMGKTLIDKDGHAHEMAGLLDLVTSFETPKLHLGYRKLSSHGFLDHDFYGHEFHYASTLKSSGMPLWRAQDADGQDLGDMGLQSDAFAGSFAHIIDKG